MGSFAPKGHARVDPRSPRAFAICDRCGFLYNHNALRWDAQWHGHQIRRTGFLVCPKCADVPNPTLRPIVLPADPVPILNPRPEPVHCHVFKPRADNLKPHHPTADTSNRMFPPVDMWRDVTVDTGDVCDTRVFRMPAPGPEPIPPEPCVPIEPEDATTDNANATADTDCTTADVSPIFAPVPIEENTGDTIEVSADDGSKLVNVMPDYVYGVDMSAVLADALLPSADNLT